MRNTSTEGDWEITLVLENSIKTRLLPKVMGLVDGALKLACAAIKECESTWVQFDFATALFYRSLSVRLFSGGLIRFCISSVRSFENLHWYISVVLSERTIALFAPASPYGYLLRTFQDSRFECRIESRCASDCHRTVAATSFAEQAWQPGLVVQLHCGHDHVSSTSLTRNNLIISPSTLVEDYAL